MAYTPAFNRRGGWAQGNSKQRKVASPHRSGLEDAIAQQLADAGVAAAYEQYRIPYVIPASSHNYTPDWLLPNGICVEAKGLFSADDRKKHLLVKEQHPQLDIRFVFSNPKTKISSTSKTTYADWCDKHGFLYAHKFIPAEWLREPKRKPVGLIEKKKKKGG